MPEITRKRVLAVTGAAAAVAGLIISFETIKTKGPAVIEAIAPFVLPVIAVFCTSSFLLLLYREWKDRKSAQNEKRLGEIRTLKGIVESVVNMTRSLFGPKRETMITPDMLTQSIDRLIEVLVEFSAYDRRAWIYSRVHYLQICTRSADWSKIEKSLEPLEDWVAFAEQELNDGKPPLRLKDPTKPRLN